MYEGSERGSCKLVSPRGVRNARADELPGISLVLPYCPLIKLASKNIYIYVYIYIYI
jgi:hypothetical protein